MGELVDSGFYAWGILPILIMLARICDVSIGTIRLMFLSRGDKVIAPLLGFFEVIIWLLAIREIMQNLANPACYIAYGAGFGLGNLVGIMIEEKLAIGKRVLRVITKKDASGLIRSLSDAGFGVTNVPAEGKQGQVNIVFMVVDRNDVVKALDLIKEFNPRAFYTIEDIRFASRGVFPSKPRKKHVFTSSNTYPSFLNVWQGIMRKGHRKGK